jgi:hypothetical protein
MLDRRQAQDLLHDLLRSIPEPYPREPSPQENYPQWKSANNLPNERAALLALAEDRADVGMALLKMAARMNAVINEQLNRVPQKNFLTFLDFMGIDPAPPTPARAALTFRLAEGAKSPGLVPKGAKVGVVDAEDVVFEVDADLTVGAVRAQRMVSLYPNTDQWTDHPLDADGRVAGDTLLFHGDPREQCMEHAVWIGHRRLLGFGEAYALGVKLKLGEPAAPYAAFLASLRWETGPDWAPRHGLTDIAGNEISIRFEGMPAVAETEVLAVDATGREQRHVSRWLRLRTTQPVPQGLPDVLSVLVTAKQKVDDAAPDLAFANASPVDLSKDFFPFGERPKFNDTLYICSEAQFSKPGAQVTLSFGLTDALPKPDTDDVTLAWEYWDAHAKTWKTLGADSAHNFIDGTDDLIKGGEVSFTCPPIGKVGVNGKENYWIRVRIAGGDYGVEAKLFPKPDAPADPGKRTLADYEYREASYKPPSISTLTISSVYEESVAPEVCLTSTASIYRDVTASRPFKLAEPAADTAPTLYLGLAGWDAFPAASVRLYFLLHPRRFDEKRPTLQTASPHAPALLLWQYWNGSTWLRMPIDDETNDLTESGIVSFDRRPDMAVRRLFGERLVWIRAAVVRGRRSSPRLAGVLPNTVWATQASSIESETLGSSNGEPSQVFRFAKAPVLDGEIVEVREPVAPPAGPVREVRDAAGNVTEVWVRWQRVNRLAASGAGDRHYEVDQMQGRLMFGDGVHGLVPPVGKSNILAYRYRSGGGHAGNRARGTITELKSAYPFVDSVVNHAPSVQGRAQEDLDRVMERAPHAIKNRGRAVTTEDFEWIGRQASVEVARTLCLSATRMGTGGSLIPSTGWVTLVVVPDTAGDRPMPDETLLARVKTAVKSQCLLNLVDSIDVVGPVYVEIAAAVVVVPRPGVEDKVVHQRVIVRLQEFLHPLRGGGTGTGWVFGRSVLLSDLRRVVRETDGVSRVLSIALSSAVEGQTPTAVPLPPSGLPCSGIHSITTARS